MANALGIVLFALGIGLTIALHEAGHMLTARAFGMRVRRFFIGFGPKVAGFTRGHTEYGVAALPLGGFCDIAGMTAMDEALTEEERPHAMFTKPAWQRVIVLSGGVAVNIVLGFAILFGVAVTSGLPDLNADMRPVVGETVCSAVGECPAGEAGVRAGDIVVALDGQPVPDFHMLRETVMPRPGEDVVLTVERAGERLDIPVTLATDGQVGFIGVTSAPLDIIVKHNAATALPATAEFSWYMATSTVQAIAGLPAKVPGVVAAIFGSERADDSPMSVVGASRVGGELVERSLWPSFFMMLASLNYFLALFNLIPVPPFDGGHIAVVVYEKLRDAVRRLRGMPAGGPVDYTRLMPITYVMAALLMAFGAIVILADVVNPIRVFG